MLSKIAWIIFFVALSQAQPIDSNRSATSFSNFENRQFKIHYNKPSITTPERDSPSESSIVQAVTALPDTETTQNKLPVVQILSTPQPVVSIIQPQFQVYGAMQSFQPEAEIPSAQSLVKFSSPSLSVYNNIPKYSTYGQYDYQEEELNGPVKYEFAYGVEDHVTGDVHSHKESRDGDFTQGEYSLHDPDGTIRTVKYTVEKDGGFRAIIERTGTNSHPIQLYHY